MYEQDNNELTVNDENTVPSRTVECKGVNVTVYLDGRIYVKDKLRKPYLNHDGYPVVSIKTSIGWRSISVARLIALAFIPNPENLPEVNHKNYDRTDFSVSNLEWITHADNVRYSNCNRPDMTGEKKPNYGNRKLSKFYAEHPEVAKEKQSRPGDKNGRFIHGKYVRKV